MTEEIHLRSFRQLYDEAKEIKAQLKQHLIKTKPWPQNLDALTLIVLRVELQEILMLATELRDKLTRVKY